MAVGTFSGTILLVDAADVGGQGTFRILVGPRAGAQAWPDGRYLRQGVRAHGWVLLDVVRLGFEVWRRLNDFPPTLPAPPDVQAGSGQGKEGSKKP